MSKSQLESLFLRRIVELGLPEPIREYRFHPDRDYRADFAYPDMWIIVEIEGGQWKRKSRHQTGTGIADDAEKYNEAVRLGWRVFRFATNQVESDWAAVYFAKVYKQFCTGLPDEFPVWRKWNVKKSRVQPNRARRVI